MGPQDDRITRNTSTFWRDLLSYLASCAEFPGRRVQAEWQALGPMYKCAVRDCLCQLSLTLQHLVPVEEPVVENWRRAYVEVFGVRTSVATCNGVLRLVNFNSIFNVIPLCSHHHSLMDTYRLVYIVEVEDNKYITLVDDYRDKAASAIRKIRGQTLSPSLLEVMVAMQLHADELTGAGEVPRRVVYPLPGANHIQSRHILMYVYERINRA